MEDVSDFINNKTFPNVTELRKFAFENISILKYNKFPDDEWYTYSDEWDINMYKDGLFNKVCVYPIRCIGNSGIKVTDTGRGIIIYKKEILITGFDIDGNKARSVKGLAFNNKGEFETGVNLKLPMEYVEVAYVLPYRENKSMLKLNLIKDIKLPITKEDVLDSDLEQTELERVKELEKRVDDIEEHMRTGFCNL
jgi:hypothetical protein